MSPSRRRSMRSPIVLLLLPLVAACGGRTAPLDETARPSPPTGDSGPGGDPAPEPVVDGIASPCNIVAAAGRLFWTTSKDQEVWGCDAGDCGTSRAFYAGHAHRALMAVDESKLYWTGHIGSCLLTGCTTPQEEHPGGYELSTAGGLAVDESRIFWTESGTLRACPKSTWASYCDELAPGHSTAVALDEQSVYWIRDGAAGSVMKMSKAGSATEELATLQNQPTGLFVEGEFVYWTTRWSAGSLLRCPKAGCAGSPTVILGGLQKPDSLLVDPRKLYWTLTPSTFESEEQDEIHACERDDCAGTRRMLGSTRSLPQCKQRLAQDDSYIYWAVDPNAGKAPVANGSIMRVRK